ncbi:MAG: START-like domain-containing protein [Mariniphaga sp.]
MKEIRLEFFLKTSPAVLFSRISTASGLAEWFADHVKEDGKIFTFIWGHTEQKAEITAMILNVSIRFRWLEMTPGYEFEFNIMQDELTGDVALIVTDNIDDDEAEDTSKLWSSQVAKLKQTIGS